MGHKLSTIGGDGTHHHRHHHHGGHRHHHLLKQQSSAAANETGSNAALGRGEHVTNGGVPTTHSNSGYLPPPPPNTNAGRNTSNGAAGLLAAVRWKSLTRRRRSGRRSASAATAAASGGATDVGTAGSGKHLLNHVNNSSFVAATTADGQIPAASQAGNGGSGVWAKLISHLSRKMAPGRRRGGGRRGSTAATAAATVNGYPHSGNGTLDHLEGQVGAAAGRPSAGSRCLHGGTSTVLPVTRHPITSVIAYGDESTVPSAQVQGTGPMIKDPLDVNSNVADIVRRITISTRCSVGRRDVIDFNVPSQPLTSQISHINTTTTKSSDNQQPPKAAPRRTIQIQASTGELLAGLGEFLRCRCRRLRHFDGCEVATWMRSVDRTLIEHAWQDTPFVGPANLVLVYLLTCDAVDPDIITVGELQAIVMACLYVAFSYAGSEISYPLKPFITSAGVDEVTSSSGGPGKKRFWNRCLAIIERSSGEMLRLNREPSYFAELFRELKTYASSTPAYSASAIAPTIIQTHSTANAAIVSTCRTAATNPHLPDMNTELMASSKNRLPAVASEE